MEPIIIAWDYAEEVTKWIGLAALVAAGVPHPQVSKVGKIVRFVLDLVAANVVFAKNKGK